MLIPLYKGLFNKNMTDVTFFGADRYSSSPQIKSLSVVSTSRSYNIVRLLFCYHRKITTIQLHHQNSGIHGCMFMFWRARYPTQLLCNGAYRSMATTFFFAELLTAAQDIATDHL